MRKNGVLFLQTIRKVVLNERTSVQGRIIILSVDTTLLLSEFITTLNNLKIWKKLIIPCKFKITLLKSKKNDQNE